MAEHLRDPILEMTFDLDQFFHTGYVIELGEGVYYRWRKDGKILYCAISRAERFPSKKAAERFIHRHLRYSGMKLYICEVCWVLLSIESEAEEADQYWDGRQFTKDFRKALTFSSYRKMTAYQKKEKLQEVSMIDMHTFRRQQVVMAA